MLLGGLGGNPDDLGIKVSKTLFAPRLGLVYRLNDDTVFRTGYGVTYNPLPFARPLRGFYPANVGATFQQNNPAGWYGTLANGIPDLTGPDLSTGRIPLPNNVAMRTPEDDVSRGNIQSWNVAVERRLPMDLSVDLAYVGSKGTDGFADLNINASDTPGGGNASRPFFSKGRATDLLSWGPRLKTKYHSLQTAVNRPFKNGLLLKGAYTWSKSMNMADEDGWVGVTWNGASQYDRNFALAGYDRTHVFQMGFVYELPFGKDGSGAAELRDQGLAGQRHLRGLLGRAVHHHGGWHGRQHAGQPADGAAGRRLHRHRRHRQRRRVVRHDRVPAAAGRRARQHRPQRLPRPGPVARGLLALPRLQRGRQPGSSSSAWRRST